MRHLLLSCTLVLTIIWATIATAATDDIAKTHEYQLNNGLQLIVQEDHRAPVVLSSIWYKVGSSYEQNGFTGISHALEHMMFRGTHQYGAGQLVKIVNTNGGLQNAMTTNDYTMYYQFLPANKLAISFQLEADRMHNLLLSPADFSKEIQVVMEERRMNWEDSPQAVTWMLLNAAAHLNNPDQHPTIGWKSDLQQMTIKDVSNWYSSWYAPNNAVLVVVGDVNPAAVYSLAKKYFDNIPTSNLPIVKQHTSEATFATRKINVRLPAKLPWLLMAYNTPSIKTAQEKWQPYALLLLADLLGSGDSSRLARDLVRKQHIAVQTNADYDAFRLYDTLLIINASPSPGHTNAEIQQATLAEIKNLQTQPISNDELQRVKAQFIAQYIFAKDSLENQASQIGVAAMIGLPWQSITTLVANIQAITPAQIQTVAQTYLQTNRLTVANLIPTSTSLSKTKPPATGDLHEKKSILH